MSWTFRSRFRLFADCVVAMPPKASPSKAQQGKLVLPAPKKTGNPVKDADHIQYHAMLHDMVEDCLEDFDGVPSLYAKHMERQKQSAMQSEEVADQDFAEVGTFNGHDPCFLAAVVAQTMT